ncbi:MAG TPA: nif-specific transcriptional activator NifA [Azospirillaceae bacterium]|nr:nif-specific transcriptional activator NifA [Azospirillaceae bacterium]
MPGTARHHGSSLELLAIYEVSKILGSSLDLSQTLREVLRLLSYHLQMQRGVICLKGEDNLLHLVAANGLSQAEYDAASFSPDEGVMGRILKTAMPVVISNMAEEPLFLGHLTARSDLDEQVASLVGVPIKAAGQLLGVLTIERVSDDGPTQSFGSDVRFLTMVANLIGQTARLHRTLAEERRHMMQEQFRLQKELRPAPDPAAATDVVHTSPVMKEVLTQVQRVASFKSTVLIRGESGTGKELIARAIHNLSPRKDGPFIRVNCAALPETLLESELFGYDKGAFTGATRDHKGRFELATGGTLFLDEIGDISASFQAKLLRVLQEQEFERVGGTRTLKTDVRIIAATNVNLEEAVGLGKFRADLYFRINVVSIFLPPLRERRGDIPALARHFVRKFSEENGLNLRIADDALETLTKCPWPGNVRELENCVERAVTQSRGGVIDVQDLSCSMSLCNSSILLQYRTPSAPVRPFVPTAASQPAAPAPPVSGCPAPSTPGCTAAGPGGGCPACATAAPALAMPAAAVDEDDIAGDPDGSLKERLVWAMERTGWVQAKAARLLGMTTRQVSYALRKYNVEIKKM